jgi:nitrite reductase (cytochrome c-552)
MDALVDLVTDIQAAKTAGATDDRLAKARDFHRRAQFYLDFIEAENSMPGFGSTRALDVIYQSLFGKNGRPCPVRDRSFVVGMNVKHATNN